MRQDGSSREADKKHLDRLAVEREGEAELIDKLASELELNSVGSTEYVRLNVADSLPDIFLGKERVWNDKDRWARSAPRLAIRRFQDRQHLKKVNFYIFDYWPALVDLKCRYIVANDTFLVGRSRISKYCHDAFESTEHLSVGATPEIFNRLGKTEIVEWGLADAVIAVGGFREILRRSVRQAIAIELREQAESGDPKASFVIISQSLGSFVILDAALNPDPPTRQDAAADITAQSVYSSFAFTTRSPNLLFCLTNQWLLLANQIPLLQLSDLSGNPATALTSFQSLNPPCDDPTLSIFSNDRPETTQVVAYHEPNDALTFYLSDANSPDAEHEFSYTNVISSFATVWIPWLVANPADAHTAQMKRRDLVKMMTHGYCYKATDKSGCADQKGMPNH